jgi:hypothetical protein
VSRSERCIHVAMNSGPDPEPDAPEAETSEGDKGPLQESQDAIDRGREAAREALGDKAPEDAGEQLEEESES